MKTAIIEKAVSGFLKTGIFPFNSAVFGVDDFLPTNTDVVVIADTEEM